MVKRMTFWQISLVAALLTIGCACCFAIAQEKLMLKYLPVDHDIEMVTLDNVSIHLNETRDPAIARIIAQVNNCTDCKTYDTANAKQCPNCCLYNNNTLIYCQDASDTVCPKPSEKHPHQRPFDTDCINCTDTFVREDCGSCPSPCAKYPELLVHCQYKGCPHTSRPDHPSCIADPNNSSIWYCRTPSAPPLRACNSTMIRNCTAYNNKPDLAYKISDADDDSLCGSATDTIKEILDNLIRNRSFTGFPSPFSRCKKYEVEPKFEECIQNCISDANQWEKTYYQYNWGMLGNAVCKEYGCAAGFQRNCNAEICQKKIDLKCLTDYTKAQCSAYEKRLRDYLLGSSFEVYQQIDPEFKYKFVVRNGERYMVGWQVLCEVILPEKDDPDKEKFNFYTMIKIFELDNSGREKPKPVYESIAHQKSLGHTFYINAQTGFSQVEQGLKSGHSYVARLYYYLPWDGKTRLEVNVSVLQMILYRAKN